MHENSLNNLRPIVLSHDEAVTNGRKGGIASGVARKEKRIIKDRILERMGDSDFDEMIDGLIERAKTNSKDFVILRDTLGQKPCERIAIREEEIPADVIEEVERAVLEMGER